MSEANKALCRRFIEEVWNRRNFAAVDELFASSYTRHTSSADPDFGSGPESVRKLVQHYSDAYPDTRFTIDDLIAEGDKVVMRWTARGTHEGELEGVPPTKRRVTVTGTTTARIANGKIAEEWENWDALGMMQQIGALPRRVAGRAGGA
jgi:steroid delta-isomerase-like uncharacterized protein